MEHQCLRAELTGETQTFCETNQHTHDHECAARDQPQTVIIIMVSQFVNRSEENSL